MYRAKDAGRNTVRLHSVEMDEELATAERIREALGVALEVEPVTAGAGEPAGLVLHYQPIVEIASGQLAYVEALARVQLADGSLVFPSQFLPVAARAGLNGALSEQVLRRALAQRARVAGPGSGRARRAEPGPRPGLLRLVRRRRAADHRRAVRCPRFGDLRDGGVRAAGGDRPRAADAAQAAHLRHRPGHRPLRHRLLVPGGTALPRSAPGEDRPLLRVEHHREQRRPGDRDRGDLRSPRAGPEGRGRGGGDPPAAGRAGRARDATRRRGTWSPRCCPHGSWAWPMPGGPPARWNGLRWERSAEPAP